MFWEVMLDVVVMFVVKFFLVNVVINGMSVFKEDDIIIYLGDEWKDVLEFVVV